MKNLEQNAYEQFQVIKRLFPDFEKRSEFFREIAKLDITSSMGEFMKHCSCCGGNWAAMICTGIKDLSPTIYDMLPEKLGNDGLGLQAFENVCAVARFMIHDFNY